ncbi:TonB-dependent receptor [Pelobium manganitolerans]|uniref:TonB-dependent receptor n=1 Tax=Pelobium manganitolerans TaxID=1842495 RepID=UPI000E72A3DD|nr:TonB-dependent receptor [Pelobium manganitolerans]
MKTLLPIAVLLLSCKILFAQNRSEIQGKIVDETDGKPIEMVTISISYFKDSSFVAYTSTTKDGEFHLKKMPSNQPLVVVASLLGYQNFAKIVQIKPDETYNFGTIKFKSNIQNLGEVVVTAERPPIVINKDTINFNVEAFKVRPNAVVEELLKKLPGIQVDNDGSITYQGKSVSKLKVDGKEFFGNDPRLASKNIDAALLDKVQVFDDRENDPDHLIPDADVSKIINLKFKKKFKKSIFGKVYAGGGSSDRFESGALLNMFRDTLQLSLIGVGNNLNRTGFSRDDLSQMGGFDRSGRNSLYDGSVNLGGSNWGGGIEKVFSGGFNLNNDYGKKLKLNLIYFYNNNSNVNQQSSFNQQFLTADTVLSNNRYASTKTDNRHSVSGLVQWNPDSTIQLRYSPKLNFNDSRNGGDNFSDRFNANGQLNKTVGNNASQASSSQFQHNFSFYKRLKKKGESFRITHDLRLNPDENLGYNNFDLTSFTSTIQSEIVRRRTGNNNKSSSVNLDASYRYPFTEKLTADVSLAGNYSLNGRQVEVYDLNSQNQAYDIFLPDQSSDLNRNQWTERVKAGLTYKFSPKISLEVGLASEWLQIKNEFNYGIPNLDQNYFNLLPSARLRLGNYNLSYNVNINQPSVYNLQPNTIRSSQLYAFTGNPDLTPSKSHNLNLSYNKYFQASQINIYSFVSANFEQNSVTTVRTYSPEGATTATPVNRNGRYNINFNLGGGKRFKKVNDWQISLNQYFYIYNRKDFFIFNQTEGFQNTWVLNVRPSFNINWKDKVELSPAYSFSPRFTSYSVKDYKDVSFTTHSFDARYTIRWPKKIYWDGVYQYQYNPNAGNGFQKSSNLLNLSVALQMLKKDRGELKLSCYDLLNQNITSYRYTGTNSIVDNQFMALKRYFLLTYTIKFNKTTTQ